MIERYQGGVRYSSEYGFLELTFVTDLMNVECISSRMSEVNKNLITLEDAERVALITSNRYIQIGVTSDLEGFYVVFHESASTGYVCKVSNLEMSKAMNGKLAKSVIESLATIWG